MNRATTLTLGATSIASFAFVVILVLAAGAVSHGLLTDDALRLWAGASTAADGQVPIGRIVAASAAAVPNLAHSFYGEDFAAPDR